MNKDHDRTARRVFDLTQLIVDGRPHRAMRLHCYHCSKPGTVMMNAMAYGAGAEKKEERMAARKFINMGWEVDLNRERHLCPDCQTPQITGEKMKKPEEKTSDHGSYSTTPDTTVVALPTPRKMEREDRRVIFEKLNEVYVDETQGYSTPWTDEMIAKDLGTPRAWVAQVREEMFGPVASNAGIDEAVKAARELTAELAKHHGQGDKLLMSANALIKQLDQIIKALGGCR